jgi:NAD(P)-dependent dehydrogenase (short-subunit alcohol dehydrogenase family)
MAKKVTLVTGASRGIGRGIALALAARGWSVGVNYRGAVTAAEETVQAIRAAGGEGLAVQADISQAQDRTLLVERMLETFGQIDLLVNNAGMAPRQRMDLLEMSETSYEEVMAVNLRGPFFLTQAVARVMIGQREQGLVERPKIINVGSISAYTSSIRRGEYCLSKAGVAMMTALFADRLAEFGICVYELRPGIIDTDMTARVKDNYDRLIADGLLPLKRWGQPDDVARAVVAIAEDYLPYSTGEVINIDGGFHLRRL